MLNYRKIPELFIVFVSVFGVMGFEAKASIILIDSTLVYQISPSVSVFEDTTAGLELDSVLKMGEKAFSKTASRQIPNLGFSRSAFWLQFELKDSSANQKEWVLDVAMPSLHQIDYHIMVDSTVISSGRTGFIVDKNSRPTPYRNPSVEFSGQPGKAIKAYMRVQSETPVILPVFLREKNQYLKYDRNRQFFLGLYFGAIIIMAFYHFYLFVSTSDKSYLWLSIFIMCFALGQMTAVYGFMIDWGFTNIKSWVPFLHVINFIAALAAIMVSRCMVNSWTFSPRCDFVLRAISLILIILAPLSPFLSFLTAERILVLFNLLPFPFLLYPAIKASWKGFSPAIYYLLATLSFFAGILIYNLMYITGIFPFNELTYFLPNVSLVITLTLFSLGLADKIKILKREREQSQKQAIASLEEKLMLQEEKTAIERELEHSRKMGTIGRLLSGIAHDIKNLVNPIFGYAQLIQKDLRNDSSAYRKISHLIDATDRLKDLTSTLLIASRNNSLNIKPLDLNQTMDQVISLLKHSAPKGVSVKLEKSDEEITVLADMGMLYSAILNVGINAVDSMPDGGTIVICTESVKIDSSFSTLHGFTIPEGHYSVIAIKDTGAGMSREILERLFEPFFTTKIEGKGTGLGLTAVYDCMKAHNGYIDVHSEPGKGSQIYLYFPCADVMTEKK